MILSEYSVSVYLVSPTDNDDRWKENCAGLSGGGYWHSGDCCYTCLTTRYPHWYDGTGAYSYMQWIEMGIRPAE